MLGPSDTSSDLEQELLKRNSDLERRVKVGPEGKECTTCLEHLPLSQFYTKGKRAESRCKSCFKAKRRATYLPKKMAYNWSHVKLATDVLMGLEIAELDAFIAKTQEVIKRCQNQKQP